MFLIQQTKTNITIDLSRMANEHNNYDRQLPHPMSSEIEFIGKNGKRVKLYIGQIATLVAIANEYPNTGKAIDTLFAGIDQGKISEICREF